MLNIMVVESVRCVGASLVDTEASCEGGVGRMAAVAGAAVVLVGEVEFVLLGLPGIAWRVFGLFLLVGFETRL